MLCLQLYSTGYTGLKKSAKRLDIVVMEMQAKTMTKPDGSHAALLPETISILQLYS